MKVETFVSTKLVSVLVNYLLTVGGRQISLILILYRSTKKKFGLISLTVRLRLDLNLSQQNVSFKYELHF